MELKDFEKIEFVFENVSIISVRKEDINYVYINETPIVLDGSPARRVTINLKANAVPLEINPDPSNWKDVSERLRNVPKRVINRFENRRGYGDIVKVEFYKSNNTRQILSPIWHNTGHRDYEDFNLYQYSGFETDDKFEFTGNYEIGFFVSAKKSYECVVQNMNYINCCAYPDETLLPYKLLFGTKDKNLNSCVLIDTGDQYIPVAVNGSKEVYIKNVWLDDLRKYDNEKVEECLKFIKKHYDDICEYNLNQISESELINRLDER